MTMPLTLFVAVACVLAVALLLRLQEHPFAGGLAALALGFVVAFYLAEGVLSMLALSSGPTAIRGSSAERVAEFRRQGVDAVFQVIPTSFVAPDGLRFGAEEGALLPLAGPSKAETVLCNRGGRWVDYHSDEHGFRNPLGLHPPAEALNQTLDDAAVSGAHSVDVALVGDSFTQGLCVRDDQELGARLRDFGWRTINLGTSGKGPLLTYATLAEYAVRLKPKVVVWLFFDGNDLADLEREKASDLLRSYLQEPPSSQGTDFPDRQDSPEYFTQNLAARQDEVDRRLRSYVESALARAPSHQRLQQMEGAVVSPFVRYMGLGLLRERLQRIDFPTGNALTRPAGPRQLDPLFRQVIASADRRVRNWGGRLVFVYLSVGADADRGGLHAGRRNEVLNRVLRLGVPVVDFHRALLEHPDPLSLFPGRQRGHYNSEGYALLATHVAAALRGDAQLREVLKATPSSTPVTRLAARGPQGAPSADLSQTTAPGA